jgi:HEPN domain-containing protein
MAPQTPRRSERPGEAGALLGPQTPRRSERPGEAGALLGKRADRRRILDSMSAGVGNTSRVVDWGAGERRRRRLETELGRIVAARERFFAQACFNAQQAAGKALKAFLYARGAEHVLGHSVADLIAECAGLDEALATLQGRVAALDQFYVATRYPNTLPGGIPADAFGQADATRALGMAGEVLEAVKRVLR